MSTSEAWVDDDADLACAVLRPAGADGSGSQAPQGSWRPLRPRGGEAAFRKAYDEGLHPFLAYAFDMAIEEVDRLGGGPNTSPIGTPSTWAQRNWS